VNHLGPSLLLPRRAHGGSGASIDAATAGRDTCDPVGGVLPPPRPPPSPCSPLCLSSCSARPALLRLRSAAPALPGRCPGRRRGAAMGSLRVTGSRRR